MCGWGSIIYRINDEFIFPFAKNVLNLWNYCVIIKVDLLPLPLCCGKEKTYTAPHIRQMMKKSGAYWIIINNYPVLLIINNIN